MVFFIVNRLPNATNQMLVTIINNKGGTGLRYKTSLEDDLKKYSPVDLHFEYLYLINMYYKKRNEKEYLEKCIYICKKDIELYPLFKSSYIKEDLKRLKFLLSLHEIGSKEYQKYQEKIINYEYPNLNIPSFKRLAIIYEDQGKYKEAIEVCKLALEYGLDDGTQGGFKGRIQRLERKIINPPTPKKPPSKKTLKRNKALKKTMAESVQDKTLIKNAFMITFSKSTSPNFDRALFLAKKADKFEITKHNNQTIYQATYLPENYLDFITLYELVGNWKSAFVFKDGEMIDRRVLGQINYCYGDKLRSHDESFCFGASMFTENPFGCHRLMIHSGQRPWYEWKKGEDSRYIYIDKDAMRKQIDSKANTYRICPAFNYDKIIDILNNLPNKIDKNSKMYKDLYASSPAAAMTFTINPTPDHTTKDSPTKRNQPLLKGSKQSSGCATALILIPLVGVALYFIT